LIFVYLSTVPLPDRRIDRLSAGPSPLASPWFLGWKGGKSVALPCHQRGGPVARGDVRCPPKAEVVSSNLAGSAIYFNELDALLLADFASKVAYR
jgi:hypothetical protein